MSFMLVPNKITAKDIFTIDGSITKIPYWSRLRGGERKETRGGCEAYELF